MSGPDGAPMAAGQQLIDGSSQPADAVTRLRGMIAERESETVQILQDWIEDPDQFGVFEQWQTTCYRWSSRSSGSEHFGRK